MLIHINRAGFKVADGRKKKTAGEKHHFNGDNDLFETDSIATVKLRR